MTMDLNTSTCPPPIHAQLNEAFREFKAIEPDIRAVLEKAACALQAFDTDHTAVMRRLEQRNLPLNARDALGDAVLDGTPVVGQLWSALYAIEEVSAKARGDNS